MVTVPVSPLCVHAVAYREFLTSQRDVRRQDEDQDLSGPEPQHPPPRSVRKSSGPSCRVQVPQPPAITSQDQCHDPGSDQEPPLLQGSPTYCSAVVERMGKRMEV
ncbi:unnamed protein product [Pleuronectes platessa]|uniref:Uncharacterized protein n=1 Tax=Pleuronectes platessa TaxID=8262 RepID=A0A9N7UC59_PLEPL|nr:unnamed protein product [Pleuronectes platessa]